MDAITNPDTTNTIDKNPEQPRRWRDVLPVHPAAELFPLMSKDELRELGEDIKKNGLTAPIIFWVRERKDWDGMARVQLLDGRNRLDAMEHVGLKLLKGGKFNLDALKLSLDLVVGVPSGSYKHVPDPYAYVLSANIHRRHLTAEQKRDLIAKLLKAKPETSNLQIAKQVKADDKTVAKVRAKLETDSEIPSQKMRVNTRGQKRPAKISTAKRQAKFEKKSFDSPQEAHASKAIVEGLSLDEFSRLPLPNKLPIPAGVNIDPFAPRPMPKTSKPRAEQKVFDSPQEAHASKTAPKPFSKDELEVLEQSWLEVKAGWLEVKAKIRTGNPAKFIPALEAHRDTIDYVLACLRTS